MSQAKGVLPTRKEDREVLYANPRTCGYFIGVRFATGTTVDQVGHRVRMASLHGPNAPRSDRSGSGMVLIGQLAPGCAQDR